MTGEDFHSAALASQISAISIIRHLSVDRGYTDAPLLIKCSD